MSLTYAIAPLVWPTNFIPLAMYPEYNPCASSDNDAVSTFKTLEVWLYVAGIDSEVTYGFTLYVEDGLLNVPNLWFGVATLNEITLVGPKPPLKLVWTDPITVSPIWNAPLEVP